MSSYRPSDYESILTLARTRGMAERMLAWHYRSKHPSLIALSNAECYASKLLLPPSPYVETEDFGLTLVKTPRGHYDRGGTRKDLVQAEAIAAAIAGHMQKFRNCSPLAAADQAEAALVGAARASRMASDRKSTRLNSSHQ